MSRLARLSRASAGLFLFGLVALLSAPPAHGQGAPAAASSVSDPWEGFNRGVFWFNDKVDTYALEPVAKGWDFITPDPVQGWLSNFFDNLNVPVVTVNALLQGKPRDAGIGLARFLVNTTVGFAGFFDPASTEFGLEKVREDFGQTLAVWGLGSGPYLVVPLLGPSNPRDLVGTGVDAGMAVYPWFVPAAALYSSRGVDLVNSRALLIDQIEASRASSFDYYVFVRDAFMQYRAALINDQEGPRQGLYERLYDVVPGN